MDFFTSILNTIGSGATAYIYASRLRDPQTRPNTLAGFQLAESGAVPFLTNLAERASAERDTWLAEKLTIHAADEKRHGQIFAHGLKQLGKQVMTRAEMKQQTEQSEQKPKNPSPFFAKYYCDYDPLSLKAENIDWLVFMGSTYILELDASKDFTRMARALSDWRSHCAERNRESKSRNLQQSILSVAQDETRHAAYLYEALQRQLSPIEVDEIVTEWRKRKIDAMFAMVGEMIKTGGNSRSLVKDVAPTEIEQPAAQLVEA
ncbi:MAG: ferritin-like domain-containing protein [Pleurocapsa sp. MO_192.B19]|nr:ferritin-like domain-containing protein [Pleurocapsa sp. MO_192.B19]